MGEKKCFFNICDDSWWTVDECGVCWGIGDTPEDSIDEAENLGLYCVDIVVYDKGDYVD